MLLVQIIALSGLSILIRIALEKNIRNWVLFIFSILFVFWFQPQSPIRQMDYWLPVAVFLISSITWIVLSAESDRDWKNGFLPMLMLIFLFLIFPVMGSIDPGLINELVSPPPIYIAGIAALIISFFLFIFSKFNPQNRIFWFILAILILLMLFVQKFNPLSLSASKALRSIQGQSRELASGSEFVWIGFSYFAFRLLHIIFDRERVKKLKLSFPDFIIYLVFPPAYVAGPIENVFHFQKEMEGVEKVDIADDLFEGSKRLALGLFFKFILADSLALLPLSLKSAQQIRDPIWMWLIVYAYTFRIFLDFAGYTHIAIGISRYLGIKMPENFKRPYLSENITTFWNRWHITLTQWIRTYFFNPVTRFLRSKFRNYPTWFIILITQVSTMLLIGLWHGVSLNFVAWGLWHGLGLFIHNRFSSIGQPFVMKVKEKIWFEKFYSFTSIFASFTFVALGWIWFALPTVSDSVAIFKLMFGFQN